MKCITSGGKALAAQTIEKVYIAGSDYLIDKDYDRLQKKMSFCGVSLFLLIATIIISVFIWLVVSKILQNN